MSRTLLARIEERGEHRIHSEDRIDHLLSIIHADVDTLFLGCQCDRLGSSTVRNAEDHALGQDPPVSFADAFQATFRRFTLQPKRRDGNVGVNVVIIRMRLRQ